MNKIIKTPNAPQAIGPYSQAIISGGFIFVSGQIHLTPSGEFVEGTIEEQTHQIMRNLKAILESAKVSFKNVVKVTIYLIDISDFGKVNTVYESYMAKPYPARETVGVKELPRGAKIEISMIATNFVSFSL